MQLISEESKIRSTPNDFSAARRAIARELGAATIARLHKQNPLFDWLAVIGLPCLFATFVVALVRLEFGIFWLTCFILQGFVIQAMAYAVHDLFVHRCVGGTRVGYVLGVLFDLPIFYRRTWYALYHLDHHKYIGTKLDPEAYKQDLDKRWKRFLCLTIVGAWLARKRKLKPPNAVSPEIGQGPLFIPIDPIIARQIRGERLVVSLTAVALIPAVALWWQPVALGFLLPLLIIAPLASILRLVLEHAEVNPQNIYQCATFYRTGVVSRVLFFWDAGDCHIVHHFFPRIPFYRMGEALKLINPILKRQGARERRSLVQLLYGFFILNEPHRALWTNLKCAAQNWPNR